MDKKGSLIQWLVHIQKSYNATLFLCSLVLAYRVIYYSSPQGAFYFDSIPLLGIKTTDQGLILAFILVMAGLISIWTSVQVVLWKRAYRSISDGSSMDIIYIPGVLNAPRPIKIAVGIFLFWVVSTAYASSTRRPDIPWLIVCLLFYAVYLLPLIISPNRKALCK